MRAEVAAGHTRRGAALAALILAVAAAGTTLSGCTSTRGPHEAEYPAPAAVASIPGSRVNTVTLTELGARRLGIRTQQVAAAPAGSTIPLTALVYGPDGDAWTYEQTAALTYVRQPVVVDRIDAGTVVLRSGPPVGTPVVTLGGQELLGAEYGVGEQ